MNKKITKKRFLALLLAVAIVLLNALPIVADETARTYGHAGIEFVGIGIIFHSNYASTTSGWEEAESVVVANILDGYSIADMGWEYRVPEFLPPVAPGGLTYQFAGWVVANTGEEFTVDTQVFGVVHVNATWYLGSDEPSQPDTPVEPDIPTAPTEPGDDIDVPEVPELPGSPEGPIVPELPPPPPVDTPTEDVGTEEAATEDDATDATEPTDEELVPVIPETPDIETPDVPPDETFLFDNDGVPLGYANPADVAQFFDFDNNGVPLGGLAGSQADEDGRDYFYFDNDVPLGAMPQTGLESNRTLFMLGLAVTISLAVATGFILFNMKKVKN